MRKRLLAVFMIISVLCVSIRPPKVEAASAGLVITGSELGQALLALLMAGGVAYTGKEALDFVKDPSGYDMDIWEWNGTHTREDDQAFEDWLNNNSGKLPLGRIARNYMNAYNSGGGSDPNGNGSGNGFGGGPGAFGRLINTIAVTHMITKDSAEQAAMGFRVLATKGYELGMSLYDYCNKSDSLGLLFDDPEISALRDDYKYVGISDVRSYSYIAPVAKCYAHGARQFYEFRDYVFSNNGFITDGKYYSNAGSVGYRVALSGDWSSHDCVCSVEESGSGSVDKLIYCNFPIEGTSETLSPLPDVQTPDGTLQDPDAINSVVPSGYHFNLPSLEQLQNLYSNTDPDGKVVTPDFNVNLKDLLEQLKEEDSEPETDPKPYPGPGGDGGDTPTTEEQPTQDEINQQYASPGLETVFPFCIPFDLIDCFKLFSAPAKAPRFELPLKSERFGIDETVVIDLTPFEPAAKVLRILLTIAFIIGLIIITRNLIGS